MRAGPHVTQLYYHWWMRRAPKNQGPVTVRTGRSRRARLWKPGGGRSRCWGATEGEIRPYPNKLISTISTRFLPTDPRSCLSLLKFDYTVVMSYREGGMSRCFCEWRHIPFFIYRCFLGSSFQMCSLLLIRLHQSWFSLYLSVTIRQPKKDNFTLSVNFPGRYIYIHVHLLSN